MSINYKHRFKKKLENDTGVDYLSKSLYSNQEEIRIKKFNEHEFGFPEDLYWIRLELIHLVQPLLKAKFGNFISKDLIQKETLRYVIKVSNNDIDLIFIMNQSEIECILLDPLESYNIKQLATDGEGRLIQEVCSLFVLYHTCKPLDCLTIGRYWDFIRTIALRYSFYPRMIFHEKSIFDSEEFQLDSIEPGFCLYSGEPIKEGFFKDGKASSDFFNSRYSKEGLFGRKVLNYSESIQNAIDNKIELHHKELQTIFEKDTKNYTEELKEEYSEACNWDDSPSIELNGIRGESLACAHELSKKVLHVSTKFNNTKQTGDISVNKIIDLFESYFLAKEYTEHFDFFDVLLLVPNMKDSVLKSFYKRGSTTFGKRSLLEQLIYKISQIKKKHCENNKNFYEQILSNGKFSIPVGTLNKGAVEKFISLEKIDLYSYPKILNLYKQHDHKKQVTLIKFQYKDPIFLNLLNEILKLIQTSGSKDGLLKNRNHLITLGLFKFHRNIIEQKIKKKLQARINQAISSIKS